MRILTIELNSYEGDFIDNIWTPDTIKDWYPNLDEVQITTVKETEPLFNIGMAIDAPFPVVRKWYDFQWNTVVDICE